MVSHLSLTLKKAGVLLEWIFSVPCDYNWIQSSVREPFCEWNHNRFSGRTWLDFSNFLQYHYCMVGRLLLTKLNPFCLVWFTQFESSSKDAWLKLNPAKLCHASHTRNKSAPRFIGQHLGQEPTFIPTIRRNLWSFWAVIKSISIALLKQAGLHCRPLTFGIDEMWYET